MLQKLEALSIEDKIPFLIEYFQKWDEALLSLLKTNDSQKILQCIFEANESNKIIFQTLECKPVLKNMIFSEGRKFFNTHPEFLKKYYETAWQVIDDQKELLNICVINKPKQLDEIVNFVDRLRLLTKPTSDRSLILNNLLNEEFLNFLSTNQTLTTPTNFKENFLISLFSKCMTEDTLIKVLRMYLIRAKTKDKKLTASILNLVARLNREVIIKNVPLNLPTFFAKNIHNVVGGVYMDASEIDFLSACLYMAGGESDKYATELFYRFINNWSSINSQEITLAAYEQLFLLLSNRNISVTCAKYSYIEFLAIDPIPDETKLKEIFLFNAVFLLKISFAPFNTTMTEKVINLLNGGKLGASSSQLELRYPNFVLIYDSAKILKVNLAIFDALFEKGIFAKDDLQRLSEDEINDVKNKMISISKKSYLLFLDELRKAQCEFLPTLENHPENYQKYSKRLINTQNEYIRELQKLSANDSALQSGATRFFFFQEPTASSSVKKPEDPAKSTGLTK